MLINNCVPNRRHLAHVVSVLAAPHQELQGSQESLDPRDHPAIVDLKDPRAQEETQVIKDLVAFSWSILNKKSKLKKSQIFDQNDGLTPLEKF